MPPPIPVVLALRQPLVLLGIRSVLAGHGEIRVVAQCSTLAAAIRALRRYRPQVLIAGYSICEERDSGLEALAEASPGTRVVLFATVADEVPDDALLRGASAVLPCEVNPQELLDCIHALAAGRRWRAPAPKSRGSGSRPHAARGFGDPSPLALLSARERQIAQGVASGKRNREIAEAFGITPGTVKLHLNRIYAKLEVNGRLALFRKLVSEANFPR